MHVSEARLAANRLNGLKGRGPVSPEGRQRSSMNAIKHSLTAETLIPEGDAEEIRRRVEALTLEMKPRTEAGAILIAKMATLSRRMEKAAEQETARVAMRVRHAADDFDEERVDQAGELFGKLGDDPRITLRRLKKRPEGVERLVEAWADLKADLAIEPDSAWSDEQLEQAANLTGLKARHAQGSRFGALNRAIQGDFTRLTDGDGAGRGTEARKGWARGALVEAIDAEIAALEQLHETLDFETLAIDRDEAGLRALFDDSREGKLARRYESEARRGFFRALQEFRRVEAEFAAQDQPAQAVATPSAPARSGSAVGSFREMTPSSPLAPPRPDPEARLAEVPPGRGVDGQPLAYIPPVKNPG